MKQACFHPEEIPNQYSLSSNCKDCGAFLTAKGVEALRLEEFSTWSEVGCHQHYLNSFKEETQNQELLTPFDNS